ncbi:MAG TPA: peptidylprolyl isomerase, partial [Candidatus Sulfotelmatobacter sp.]|nr:peptidylprolyl isomerase [Candidatus Sulfotelmatobacter sp.]
QQANFSTKAGKDQLASIKKQAMNEAINNELVNKLASQYNVSVSDSQVNNELNVVESENRLGSSQQVFKEVLSQYWGWDISDFKRELKQQMLQQAVVSKLDTATHQDAQNALEQLQKGANFGALAGEISDDASTKTNGGQYPNAITLDDQQISPIITQELFALQPNQISPIINTGYTLEILTVLNKSGDSLHAAHIQFNFKDISVYTAPLLAEHPTKLYISVNN